MKQLSRYDLGRTLKGLTLIFGLSVNSQQGKQLKNLKARGWRRVLNGIAWQSPYDAYYYSPQMATVKEVRKAES